MLTSLRSVQWPLLLQTGYDWHTAHKVRRRQSVHMLMCVDTTCMCMSVCTRYQAPWWAVGTQRAGGWARLGSWHRHCPTNRIGSFLALKMAGAAGSWPRWFLTAAVVPSTIPAVSWLPVFSFRHWARSDHTHTHFTRFFTHSSRHR